ncbi:MAG: hypothetical protein AB8G99_02440 [Planctomycetaceae bacterium]
MVQSVIDRRVARLEPTADVGDSERMIDEPLAFFITWTVYGTHLQGDNRGWRRRSKGEQLPEPRLLSWRQERLKHEILLLDPSQQQTVMRECRKQCDHRAWRLWAIAARSNHVHAVVAATNYNGSTVRDQLKANATRGLREQWSAFANRPVWTKGGDWQCINTIDGLDSVIEYVTVAQDRMDRPK